MTEYNEYEVEELDDDIKASLTHSQCEGCGEEMWTDTGDVPSDWDYTLWDNDARYLLCGECYGDAYAEFEYDYDHGGFDIE